MEDGDDAGGRGLEDGHAASETIRVRHAVEVAIGGLHLADRLTFRRGERVQDLERALCGGARGEQKEFAYTKGDLSRLWPLYHEERAFPGNRPPFC